MTKVKLKTVLTIAMLIAPVVSATPVKSNVKQELNKADNFAKQMQKEQNQVEQRELYFMSLMKLNNAGTLEKCRPFPSCASVDSK